MYNDTIFSEFTSIQFLAVCEINSVVSCLILAALSVFLFAYAKDEFDAGSNFSAMGTGIMALIVFISFGINAYTQSQMIKLAGSLVDKDKKIVVMDNNANINIKDTSSSEKTIVFPDGQEIKLISPPIDNNSKVSSDWNLKVRNGKVIIEKKYNF